MPKWIKKSYTEEILHYKPNLNMISPATIEFRLRLFLRGDRLEKYAILVDFYLYPQEQMLQTVLAKLQSFPEIAKYKVDNRHPTTIGIDATIKNGRNILSLLWRLNEIEPTIDSQLIVELIAELYELDVTHSFALAPLYDKNPSTAIKEAIELDIKEPRYKTCYNLVMYILIKFDTDLAKLDVENLSYDEAMSIAERLDKYLSHLDILFDSLNLSSIHSAIEKILPCIMHAKNLIQDYGLEFQSYDMNKLNKFHLRLLMGEPNKWQSEINNLSAELAGLSLGDHSLGEIKIDAKTIIKLLEVIADQQKKAENLQKKVPASRDTLVAYKNQASKDITTDNEEKDLTKSQILKQNAARERRKSF